MNEKLEICPDPTTLDQQDRTDAFYEHILSCQSCQEQHRETFRVNLNTIAYLVPYEITRHYGGSEEGGWWYDRWNFLHTAIPFDAQVVYEKEYTRSIHPDVEKWELSGWDTFQESRGDGTYCYAAWVPRHIRTHPGSPLGGFRASAEAALQQLYPTEHSGRGRFSAAQTHADYVHRVEVGTPGQNRTCYKPHYE